jgi:hypothetical protein
LLSSFAGRVAEIAGSQLLGFQSGLPFDSLGIFRLPRLVLGFQSGFVGGGLGDSLGGQSRGFPSFDGRSGGLSLGHPGIARHADRLPCRPMLDGGGAVGGGFCASGPLQLELLRIRGCFQAVGKMGVFDVVILQPSG